MRGGIVFPLLFTCAVASAGFYDFDSTLDHHAGLPSVEAILAGKFEQHSPEYYQRTIPEQERRSKSRYVPGKPIEAPDAITYVPALARTGDLAGALKAVDPQRNFATDSPIENSMRASILTALGDPKAAAQELKAFIDRAPSSPFRREEYELKLAEYLAAVQTDPPLAEPEPTFVRRQLLNEITPKPNATATRPTSERWWLQARDANPQQLQEAMTAITAMIRFGDLGSAHHYAALGDLLRARGEAALAYRAYRRALDYAHPWPDAIEKEIETIREELGTDERISDATIDAEQRSALEWVKAYHAFEIGLMQEGRLRSISNVWDPFYAKHGNLREPPESTWDRASRLAARMWPALTVVTLILLVSSAMLIRWARQRFEGATITATD